MTGVGLGAGHHPIPPVKVRARRDMIDRLVDVDEVEEPEERQRIESAVEEPRVFLPPFIAGERAGIAVLEVRDVWNARLASWAGLPEVGRPKRTLPHPRLALPARFQLVKGVQHGEDLHRANGGEHVGVVERRSAKAAAIVLA